MRWDSELPRAFISYSHKDSEFVDRLIIDLIKASVEIWFDRWEIKVGDSIIDKIQSGIKENDYLIVVLSSNSVASDWVNRELSSALVRQLNERKITILPVLIERCEVPVLINPIKFADFTKDYRDGLLNLLDIFTNRPPRHFTQAFDETDIASPEAVRMNNKAGDLIIESYNVADKTNKFNFLDEAESLLSKILSKEPRFGQARQNLGTIQYERGLALKDKEMIKKSIDIFQQALKTLKHFDQIAICNYSIGRAYARLGNFTDGNDEKIKFYEEAIPFLAKAIKEDKRLHFAHCWLARVYYENYKITQNQGDYRKAKEYYTEAVILNPAYLNSLGEMTELNSIYYGKIIQRPSTGIKLWDSLVSKIKSRMESKRDAEAKARLFDYIIRSRK